MAVKKKHMGIGGVHSHRAETPKSYISAFMPAISRQAAGSYVLSRKSLPVTYTVKTASAVMTACFDRGQQTANTDCVCS